MMILTPRRKLRLANLLLANLCMVGTLLSALAAAALLSPFTENPIALSTVPLLLGALAVTAATVAVHPAATWRSLGFGQRAIRGVVPGLLLGAVACGLLVVLAVICGLGAWTTLAPEQIRFDWRETWLTGIAFLAIGAIGEEVFARGMLLQFLAGAFGRAAGVIATSLVFALLHGANPGVTALAQVNTALFGAVFGLAIVRHRSLWMAIGLHLGWNLAQVALGANNSGITIRLTELNLQLRGEDWLSGGNYGLEGGVLATATALLLVAAVWCFPRSNDGVEMLWETGRKPVQRRAQSRSGISLGLSPSLGADDSGREERAPHGGAARRDNPEP